MKAKSQSIVGHRTKIAGRLSRGRRFFAHLFVILFMGWLLFSCQLHREGQDLPVSVVFHPQWSINANIYEVNLRQYTPEGTFNAFAQHLDRLQEMGVDIFWFMPVTPIGELNRKGTLGSYYSVKDYTAINPEFGTMEDFRMLVDDIHSRGMYVILDWVANHTAWDHHWTVSNPEYYVRDEAGSFMPPDPDWSDVIHLNYDNPDVWDAMIGEMLFWVRDVGVDGFRCDVAYLVPAEFWNRARAALDAVKPVFMLAEAETHDLHLQAFNAGYGWHFHHMMNRVARGEETVAGIDNYFFSDNISETRSAQAGFLPAGSYKMYFITNHDENSWAGTEFMRMGEGVEAFAVLTATMPGMVLVYSGQEAGFDRMLEFFEKDEIVWGDYRYHDFYKNLLHLKRRNMALWNGLAGAELQRVNTSHDEKVFAFVREMGADKVFVLLNLSDDSVDVECIGELFAGTYTELFTNQTMEVTSETIFSMNPWGYYVLEGVRE